MIRFFRFSLFAPSLRFVVRLSFVVLCMRFCGSRSRPSADEGKGEVESAQVERAPGIGRRPPPPLLGVVATPSRKKKKTTERVCSSLYQHFRATASPFINCISSPFSAARAASRAGEESWSDGASLAVEKTEAENNIINSRAPPPPQFQGEKKKNNSLLTGCLSTGWPWGR